MGLEIALTPGYQAPSWAGGEEGLGSHSAQIQSRSVLGEPAWVTGALQASVLTPGRWESKVTQSCLTLCDPTDYSLPGSSIHGILQTRILEPVAISFSRGSSRSRDQTRVSCIAGRFFTITASREAFQNSGKDQFRCLQNNYKASMPC